MKPRLYTWNRAQWGKLYRRIRYRSRYGVGCPMNRG